MQTPTETQRKALAHYVPIAAALSGVRLVQGFQAQRGRRRTYPTAAMAREYDHGWCAARLEDLVPGPATDGFWDRESFELDCPERDEVCDA